MSDVAGPSPSESGMFIPETRGAGCLSRNTRHGAENRFQLQVKLISCSYKLPRQDLQIAICLFMLTYPPLALVFWSSFGQAGASTSVPHLIHCLKWVRSRSCPLWTRICLPWPGMLYLLRKLLFSLWIILLRFSSSSLFTHWLRYKGKRSKLDSCW